MANKIQGVISKYMGYYTDVTGKSTLDFMENRKIGNGDWLAEHIDSTLKGLGVTDVDIQNYVEAIKRGYRSALSECMSTSPEMCNKIWEYTKKHLDWVDNEDVVIWDPACGNGRLEIPVSNKNRVFLSTIGSDDVGIARRVVEGATVFRNDFMSGIDYDDNNAYFSQTLPDSLVAKLKSNAPIVFLVEPSSFINGNNDIKDILKSEYEKFEIENGVLQYFKRIKTIIDFYGLTNVHIVMIQFIERDSWLKTMIEDFKPIGGLCYEFNKVTHKYRAAIIWKYEPTSVDSEEYKNRFTVNLDKYNINNDNKIEYEKQFIFEIKAAHREYSKGSTIAYQTSDNCFTNIETDNAEAITALDIYNKLPICVMKHLVSSGMLNKDAVIDNTLLDEQWYIDCIPLFLFSKYNKFESRDGVHNTMFPLNPQKIKAHIKDSRVLASIEGCKDTNIAGLDIVADNYNKLSPVAKSFMDFCIKIIVDSYITDCRKEMDYIEGTENWDAGISQLRRLNNLWTVEVEDRYNKLQNDLVTYLAQKIMGQSI